MIIVKARFSQHQEDLGQVRTLKILFENRGFERGSGQVLALKIPFENRGFERGSAPCAS